MDYIGSAIAIAVFTLVASFWFNGPAVSAEATSPDFALVSITR